MAKTPPKDYFASVMFPGTKKLSIVSKRVGTKERLHQIAVVTSEMVADRIVEALNHHQGALEKLEAPAHKRIEELEHVLKKERVAFHELRQKNNGLLHDIERLKIELRDVKRGRDAAHDLMRKHALTPT